MASDAALKSADSYLPRLWSFASCSGPLRFAQLHILALGDHWCLFLEYGFLGS